MGRQNTAQDLPNNPRDMFSRGVEFCKFRNIQVQVLVVKTFGHMVPNQIGQVLEVDDKAGFGVNGPGDFDL